MSSAVEGGEVEGARVTVENRQAAREIGEDLREALEQAGRDTLALVRKRGLALGEVPGEVAVALVDDVMIAEVHGQYMDDPTPTDVITFPYGGSGEVLISVETAEAQGAEYGTGWEEEIALYLVHGILHLCGYEDTDEEGRARMAELQGGLVREVFGEGRGTN